MDLKFEVAFQDGDDTLVRLEAALPVDFIASTFLNLDTEQLGHFSRWMQGTVQPLLEAGQIISAGSTYRIVIDPKLQQRIIDGTAVLRSRNGNLTGTVVSTAAESKGQLLGFAELQIGQVAQIANMATVAWQVAAMVTAQHFLSEINQELKLVNRKLDDLLEFLETQAAGRIVGRLKALQRSTQLMQLRALDAEEVAVLKQDILLLVQEAEAQAAQYIMPFAPLKASLQNAKDFRAQDVEAAVQKYAKHLNTAVFAIRAYVNALSMAPHAGWAHDRLKIHLESVEELIDFLDTTVDDFDRGLDALEERGKKRDSRWRLHPAAEGALAVIPYGRLISILTGTVIVVQEYQKAQREKQREKIMTAKRPLIELQKTALDGLRASVEAIRKQTLVLEERRKAPQVLLVEVGEKGAVKQLFVTGKDAVRA
ncbi:hypothetical protein DKM44_14435 [Deinococcus irradiatisoli]|uniref:Uncharacterized protein n=1 Tax=Deinococcus irradiatisoli TaxID=2202254 RepID=A0A2Z3JNC1_9DEIO|nr:hypothetical protein [Deinococcus irradiatisoli]AWN24279.1 hypothetical protein DKM44_14435 [Deinococcus irradiatisoli]